MASVTYVGTRNLAPDVLGEDAISPFGFTSGLGSWSDTSAAGGTVSVTPQGRVSLEYATGRPSITYALTTVAGQLYRVDVDTVQLDQQVSHWFGTSSGGTQLGVMTPTAVGAAAGFFVATGTASYIRINGPTSANTNAYDNVRVRPVQTRGHATDINHVINGSFTVNAVWTLGTGWTINSGTGKADCDGTQTSGSAIYTADYEGDVRIGKTYNTSFTTSNVSAGSVGVNVQSTGSQEGTGRATNGTFTEQITVEPTTSGTYKWGLNADADFVGSVDNFSVTLASGNTWDLDFEILNATYNTRREVSKDIKTSLDRSTIVTTYDGGERYYTFTTKEQTYLTIPFMEEWLHSVEDGTVFTFDPYGSADEPDNPISVTLDAWSKSPIAGASGGRAQFRYQITLRESA